jgi:hypothetical protein
MQSFVGPAEPVPIEATDMDDLELFADLNAQDDDGLGWSRGTARDAVGRAGRTLGRLIARRSQVQILSPPPSKRLVRAHPRGWALSVPGQPSSGSGGVDGGEEGDELTGCFEVDRHGCSMCWIHRNLSSSCHRLIV